MTALFCESCEEIVDDWLKDDSKEKPPADCPNCKKLYKKKGKKGKKDVSASRTHSKRKSSQ